MTKKDLIISEYLKNPSQSYRNVYDRVKSEIETTYNYVKRILSEYKRKNKPSTDAGNQSPEDSKSSNRADDTISANQKEKSSDIPDFSILKKKRKVLFVSDIHVPFHSIDSVRTAFDYALSEHVNEVVLGGDIMDNYSLSFWKSRARADFLSELNAMRNFLAAVRDTFTNSKIWYLWGNHEIRHERYLLAHAEKLFGIEELSLENLLKLSEFNIRKIDNRDHIQRFGKPFQIGKLYFLHGHEVRASWGAVNIARNLYLKTQDNIIFGHFHQTQEYIQKNINGDVRGSWAVGCLCDMNPDYAVVNNWNHGFAIIEFEEGGDFTVFNRKIINGKVV